MFCGVRAAPGKGLCCWKGSVGSPWKLPLHGPARNPQGPGSGVGYSGRIFIEGGLCTPTPPCEHCTRWALSVLATCSCSHLERFLTDADPSPTLCPKLMHFSLFRWAYQQHPLNCPIFLPGPSWGGWYLGTQEETAPWGRESVLLKLEVGTGVKVRILTLMSPFTVELW